MYKRVIYEAWVDWVPYVAFGITALVFLTFVIRALTLRRERAESMAMIPLQDGEPAACPLSSTTEHHAQA